MIQEIHCKTVDDMLDYLRPSHDRWLTNNREEVEWIFRGHQQEEWKLESSALRENVGYFEPFREDFHAFAPMISLVQGLAAWNLANLVYIDGICKQTAYEQRAIHEFIEAADDVGLLIPDDSISRDFQLDFVEFVKRLFDDKKRHPWYLQSDVVALAQHHRIPTRLLDWTEDPWVAAFFAANGESVGKNSENIAVWALRRVCDGDTDLRFFEPRKSRIGYLHAQKGLFIYDIMANEYYLAHGTWRTIEAIVANFEDQFPIFDPIEYWLRKITLPAIHAKELLLRLKAHKIERRFLMSTYDNVAEELYTRRKIDQEKKDKIHDQTSSDG